MLFSDFFFIEVMIMLVTLYFILSNNMMMLLYNSGLYLVFIGLYSLLQESDMYMGFLWVMDLGVGLVFFIFMLHLVPFLHQKSKFNFSTSYFFSCNLMLLLVALYLYWFAFNVDMHLNSDLGKIWFFQMNFLDYYLMYFSSEVSELNFLSETYFLMNGFEFFLMNFSLFFGLVTAILMCFMIHRVFNFLNYSQIKNIKLLKYMSSSFFIRNQNFISQSNTPMTTKVWSSKKF